MTELERVKKELRETKAILSDLLQEQTHNAAGVIKSIEEGATPDNLRTLAVIKGDDEGEKRKLADGILYQIYRGWVKGEVDELVRAVLDGEIEDGEQFEEQMYQNTENSLIYTHDQYLVIHVADNSATSAGSEEAAEMAGSNHPQEQVGIWALLTYRYDVRDSLGGVGLDDPNFDREMWLERARNGEYNDWDESLRARARRAR